MGNKTIRDDSDSDYEEEVEKEVEKGEEGVEHEEGEEGEEGSAAEDSDVEVVELPAKAAKKPKREPTIAEQLAEEAASGCILGRCADVYKVAYFHNMSHLAWHDDPHRS